MSSSEIRKAAWEDYSDGKTSPDIRKIILSSWDRCKSMSVSMFQKFVPNSLRDESIETLLKNNCDYLEMSRPTLDNLYHFVSGSGIMVALSDEEGFLLDIMGDHPVVKSASRGNWSVGTNWSEKSAGTNAVGTAIYTNQPIQVIGHEHYCICSHAWTGSGAPIHDSLGNTIGSICMTGLSEKMHNHTLGMVVAAAKAIETQMAMKETWNLLNREHHHKSTIIDTISEGLIVVNSKRAITLINKHAQNILKTGQKELIGKHIEEIFGKCKLTQAILNNEVIRDSILTLKFKNNITECNVTCQPIVEENNHDGFVIIISEFSRVKKLAHKIFGTEAKLTFSDIVGKNVKFLETLDVAKAASFTDSNVLLLGESGTGKDIFAQAIHNNSKRAKKPFVAINCGAIPRELIGSELFGYAEGAFTGAKKGGNPGKFELANEGTIFLDEIGDMPLELQIMILRVIEQKTFSRIGGQGLIPVNVRIIAATNKNLEDAVMNNNFRQDLYYRLNVLSINMIPLRERIDDIPLLTERFLSNLSKKMGKENYGVSDEVYRVFSRHNWYGNVRELQNVLERALLLSSEPIINIGDLPYEITRSTSGDNPDGSSTTVKGSLKDVEANAIKKLLDQNEWNISKVSYKLGIARTTLYRKIALYNLKKPNS